MKIHPAQFAVPVALMLQSLVQVAWAQEPAKQPPLELPKSLAQMDMPKTANAMEDKEKSKSAPIKKAKAVVAEPLPDMAVEPANEPQPKPDTGTYKVKAGDTIDRVIQKFYANSPLRTEVLRNALIQSNPQAFVKANPKSLIAGSVLVLPDQLELLKKVIPALAPVAPVAPDAAASTTTVANVTPVAAPPSLPAPVGGAAAHQAGHNPGLDINKRNWVRFP